MKASTRFAALALTLVTIGCAEDGPDEWSSEERQASVECTKIPASPVRRTKVIMLEGECPMGYEKLGAGEADRLARESEDASARNDARIQEAQGNAALQAQQEAFIAETVNKMAIGSVELALKMIADRQSQRGERFAEQQALAYKGYEPEKQFFADPNYGVTKQEDIRISNFKYIRIKV